MHFDFVDAVASASFATAAFDIETETTGFVAAQFGFGLGGKKVADESEDAGVSGGIAARGAADGGLVDNDGFFELIDAFDAVVKAGGGFGAMETGGEFGGEDGVD